MNAKETKLCPACQHENKVTATICENCRRVLSIITTAVTYDDSLDVPNRERLLSESPKLRPGVLTLLFPGEAHPLTAEIQDEMTLGRSVPGSPMPTIDLSPYSATVLGVSRDHAKIRFEHGQATITDQNSSNGTWVNQKYIGPNTEHKLRSGDLLRLGNMLIFVYFSSGPPAKKTILLMNTSQKAVLSKQQYLTLSDVNDNILPYLKALFEIQSLIYQNNSERRPQAGIEYIGWSMAHLGVHIRLRNVDELIEFLNIEFQPNAAPASETVALQAAGQSTPPPSLDNIDKGTTELDLLGKQGSDQAEPKPTRTIGILTGPRPTQQELSQAIIERFAEDLSEVEQKNLRERLLPHLEVLLESPFDLHIVRNS